MIINRENAMYLWTKTLGDSHKAKDFSGRLMEKGAYGDRNSKYGWNIDHILPKSQGGSDSEYNLICSHIKTNSEKADSFPCFNANNRNFEIIKVKNHFEIRETSNHNTEQIGVNFYDHSSGLAFFKECLNAEYFTVSINIKLVHPNDAIIEFLSELFKDNDSFHIEFNNGVYYLSFVYFNINNKDRVQELLDNCLIFNTYSKYYFTEKNYLNDYAMIFALEMDKYNVSLDYFESRYFQSLEKMDDSIKLQINTLANNNIIHNKVNISQYDQLIRCTDLIPYDYIFTNLKENLLKEEK